MLVRAWLRQLLGASGAALIAPVALAGTVAVLALGGGFGQLGALGQVFSGPSAVLDSAATGAGIASGTGAQSNAARLLAGVGARPVAVARRLPAVTPARITPAAPAPGLAAPGTSTGAGGGGSGTTGSSRSGGSGPSSGSPSPGPTGPAGLVAQTATTVTNVTSALPAPVGPVATQGVNTVAQTLEGLLPGGGGGH